MRINEAINAIKAGRKVRNVVWKPNRFVHEVGGLLVDEVGSTHVIGFEWSGDYEEFSPELALLKVGKKYATHGGRIFLVVAELPSGRFLAYNLENETWVHSFLPSGNMLASTISNFDLVKEVED